MGPLKGFKILKLLKWKKIKNHSLKGGIYFYRSDLNCSWLPVLIYTLEMVEFNKYLTVCNDLSALYQRNQ